MELKSNPKVGDVFKQYPKNVKQHLVYLRSLIINVASGIKGLTMLEETLKWGEPSYLTKYGSTIRMNWKKDKPDQYAIYFKCTSKLVPTFKTLFLDKFIFEGKRAIVFKLDENIPEPELRKCITMALTYHKVKHLPFLGA